MTIAILGSGNVGNALAQSLVRASVAVRFGVRNAAAWGTTHPTGAPR